MVANFGLRNTQIKINGIPIMDAIRNDYSGMDDFMNAVVLNKRVDAKSIVFYLTAIAFGIKIKILPFDPRSEVLYYSFIFDIGACRTGRLRWDIR